MAQNNDTTAEQSHKVDRLLDAIELVKEDKRDEAMPILSSIIREDANFEEAWLWMSVAVDDIDQSIICLDNVLRINPDNIDAATALYRLRQTELAAEYTRKRLRRVRDLAQMTMWLLIAAILFAMFVTFSSQIAAIEAVTPTLAR